MAAPVLPPCRTQSCLVLGPAALARASGDGVMRGLTAPASVSKRQLTARWFCRKAASSGDWWATTTGNGAAGTTGAALAWWNHGNNTQDWQAQLAAVSKVSCTRTQARTNTRPTTHRFQQAPARLPIDMCCIDACHKHVARQEATSTLQDVCTGRSVSTCEPTFRVR